MPGTFTQIYIQVIFAVKDRESMISPTWEDQLYKYISGIIRNKEQKLLAINGMPDHIHFLMGMKPSCTLSDLVREIKKSSNEFIKGKKFTTCKFQWQEGYGAFSYSHTELDNVIGYIQNQKQHHTKKTFREEYEKLMSDFRIDYKPEYLFDWINPT
ncbi:MAG: IS200/IS605 family transposase [Cytophagales bacterium]|nr:IS200/IS605 family transposase [Cytophagales bacterium]